LQHRFDGIRQITAHQIIHRTFALGATLFVATSERAILAVTSVAVTITATTLTAIRALAAITRAAAIARAVAVTAIGIAVRTAIAIAAFTAPHPFRSGFTVAAGLELLRELGREHSGRIRYRIRRQIIAAALFTRTTAPSATATTATVGAELPIVFAGGGRFVIRAAQDRQIVVVFAGEEFGRVRGEFGA